MQLNLRHIVKRDILIYPGYVPEPGVKYKVFHYGLRFGIGNWSFDKADWRDIDMVNTCWAKFPEPPDPSTLSMEDENILQRDLLSIECGKALNRALYVHHKRRNCPPSDAISNSSQVVEVEGISFRQRHEENNDNLHITKKIPVPFVESNMSSIYRSNNGGKSSRIWMVGLWAFSVLGFLAVISMVLSTHKGEGSRRARNKKTYAGVSDTCGNSHKFHDKHIYDVEIASDD